MYSIRPNSERRHGRKYFNIGRFAPGAFYHHAWGGPLVGARRLQAGGDLSQGGGRGAGQPTYFIAAGGFWAGEALWAQPDDGGGIDADCVLPGRGDVESDHVCGARRRGAFGDVDRDQRGDHGGDDSADPDFFDGSLSGGGAAILGASGEYDSAEDRKSVV